MRRVPLAFQSRLVLSTNDSSPQMLSHPQDVGLGGLWALRETLIWTPPEAQGGIRADV